ncbi:MAG: PIN domain-containing protein [Bergeyella sp.]
MKFFLDTNIIVDFVMMREQFYLELAMLVDYISSKNVEFYTSSHAIATTHYVCRKKYSENEIRVILENLLSMISVVSVDEEILRKSLKSHHKDFEDAVQIFCAHQIKKLDGIITRNLKDFSTSEIPVFSPDEALIYIKKKLK